MDMGKSADPRVCELERLRRVLMEISADLDAIEKRSNIALRHTPDTEPAANRSVDTFVGHFAFAVANNRSPNR
jgi:hypothetical protein